MALAMVAAGTLAALSRRPLPDTAWPLYLARALSEGASLTGDFQEMNPPLFVWLSLPAVWLAKATDMSLWTAAVLLLAGVSISSLVLADRILSLETFRRQRPWLLPVIAFTYGAFPLQEYTNREHLALVLVAPYLLLAGLRGEAGFRRPRLAWPIGVLGGIGFAYKPYFLAAWILVEGYLVFHNGWRSLVRTEALALMATGASYAVAILLFEPGYLDLARTWAGLYGQYMREAPYHAMFPDLWSILPVAAIGAVLALQAKAGARPVHYVLLTASIGFWIGAVLQQKAFGYHHLTGGGLAFLALAWTSASRLSGRVRRPSDLVFWLGRATVIGIAGWSLLVLGEERAGRRPPRHLAPTYPALLAAVRELAAGQPIFVLSSNPAVGWPLTLESGAVWGSRFMCQWQLAALYHEQLWLSRSGIVHPRPFDQREGVERSFHEAMIADLLRSRPEVIVSLRVDSTVRGFGGATRIDYMDYFSSDPRFARLLSLYEETGDFGFYRLFRRRDGVH